MWAIMRKELADHFSSTRFVTLLLLILMVSLISTYMVGAQLKQDLQGAAAPRFVFLLLFTASGNFFSLTQFVAFCGPLVGLILGFDAVSRERAGGTLALLVSQPIHRDAVILGKLMAGVVTVAVMLVSLVLLISGLGLSMLGLVPEAQEVARLVVYLVVSVFYVSFWLAVSILFSILLRSSASSALASLAVWIFLSFFAAFGASLAAQALHPVSDPQDLEGLVAQSRITQDLSRVSPAFLYTEATSTILDPYRKTTRDLVLTGQMERISMERFQNPLPLAQSVLVVVPYLTTLLAVTLVCCGLSYLVFMRQEVRSA